MINCAVRVGLIGLGRMGARQIEAIAKSGATLVAAHDKNATPYALDVCPGISDRFVADRKTFWQQPMDLAIIATTGPSHIPILMEGLAHGVPRFVVEKPFATGVDEARNAMKRANQLGRRVIVNHGRRYDPRYAHIETLNGSDAMGKLRSISVSLGAGGLGCVGIHYLDLFSRFFSGAPDLVTAFPTGPTPANPRGSDFFDPGACAVLYWADGRRAVIEVADDTGIPPLLDFRFATGRVLIENETGCWRTMCRSGVDRELPLTRYGQPLVELPTPGLSSMDLLEMSEAVIVDALSDGPAISDMSSAVIAVTMYAAIRHAMETKKTVGSTLPKAIRQKTFAIP